MKYPIKVSMPPGLTRSFSGQTYIIAGCMIPVPDGTTWDDMDKYVTYVRPDYSAIKSWKISSSTGGKYEVKRFNKDRYTCTCLGFKFNKKCKHITKVKS
jgi:hypothetical protein